MSASAVDGRRVQVPLPDGEHRLVAMAGGLLLVRQRYAATQVWDLDRATFCDPLPGDLLATSPDGRFVALIAHEGYQELVEVRELARGAVVWRDQPNGAYRPLCAAFSGDSSTLAFCTRNGYWDHGEGFVVRVSDGPGARRLRFSSEAGQPSLLGLDETGARVVSEEHGALDVVEVASAHLSETARTGESPLALWIHGDGTVIAQTHAGALLRWLPGSGIAPIAGRGAVGPSARALLLAGDDGTTRIEHADGRTITLDMNPTWTHAAWLDDARVATSDGADVTVWDAAGGAPSTRLAVARATTLLAAPDGRLLAGAGSDLTLFDLRSR